MTVRFFMSLYEPEQFLVGSLYLLYISPGAAIIFPSVVFNFLGTNFLEPNCSYHCKNHPVLGPDYISLMPLSGNFKFTAEVNTGEKHKGSL